MILKKIIQKVIRTLLLWLIYFPIELTLKLPFNSHMPFPLFIIKFLNIAFIVCDTCL